MNQSGDTIDFTFQNDETFNEIYNDLDYGQVEIKPFKLESLFMEIEQILLSPLQLEPVSLTA